MKTITITPPLQTSFQITTNSEALIHLLKLKYGDYATAHCTGGAKCISAILTDGIYEVAFDGQTVRDSSGAFAVDEIIANNTEYDSSVFALHGGAVEWQGRAYLFLASTTSGKSTLTSFLAHSGFGYITDDCILLDRTSFAVYPFHTPIHLRDGGLAVLKQCGAAPGKLEIIDDEKFTRYVYTPENCAEHPAALDKIFFINRTEGENSLSAMDTTSRMTALMKAPITPYAVSPDYLKFLSRLSAQGCLQLNYCDMNYVAEVIKNG